MLHFFSVNITASLILDRTPPPQKKTTNKKQPKQTKTKNKQKQKTHKTNKNNKQPKSGV